MTHPQDPPIPNVPMLHELDHMLVLIAESIAQVLEVSAPVHPGLTATLMEYRMATARCRKGIRSVATGAPTTPTEPVTTEA